MYQWMQRNTALWENWGDHGFYTRKEWGWQCQPHSLRQRKRLRIRMFY